jgi:hypothetical protein
MRKFLPAAAVLVAALTITGVALAGHLRPLIPFGDANITISGDSARVVVGDGQYGGVYDGKAVSKRIGQIKALSFVSSGDVGGGAPRWSIPIDTDGHKNTTEGYAFLDAAGCGAVNGTNDSGQATVVSTKNDACHVNFQSADYANWTTFAAVHPNYRTSKDVPFVIADTPGDYFVSVVRFYQDK